MLIVAVGTALAFGLYRASVDGRFVGTHRLPTPTPPNDAADAPSLVEERAPASVSRPGDGGGTSQKVSRLSAGGASHLDQRDSGGASQPVSPPDQREDPTPSLVEVAAGSGLDLELGERATLLQFSSAFCAPCRVTRRTLAEVATVVPGVRHVEVDAEHHLELVRAVGVLRTPTTLVLDARGAEVARAAGAPRKEQVLSALARA